MAKRINYGFEKRQKEAKRKKKQADKLEKKRSSRETNTGVALPVGGVPIDADVAPGDDIVVPTPTDDLPG